LKAASTILLLILIVSSAYSQKYIIVDSYGTKRWRLDIGDEIRFKTIDSQYRNFDFIKELQDSLVLFKESGAYVHINEFEILYKPRPVVQGITTSSYFPATGFLFSGLVAYPLITNPAYSQSDAIILGLGFLALGQILRPIHYKKYFTKRKSRIRIMDVRFQ
jgi:hypothetical protein